MTDATTMQCEICERYHPADSVHAEQVSEIYDGVLIWHGLCGHSWPRFIAGPRRHAAECILAFRAEDGAS